MTQAIYDSPFTLIGENGDVIRFAGTDGVVIGTLGGNGPIVSGLHAAPVTIQSTDGVLDGSRYQGTRRNARVIDMSVLVFGADFEEFRANLRRFHRVLSGRMVLSYQSTFGDVYQTEVYYNGGGTGERGIGVGTTTYQQYVITLWAGDPYWTSTTPVTQSFRLPTTTRGLLPRLVNLKLNASQVLGMGVPVENDGDVPAYPIWTINGPFTSVTVRNSTIDRGFTYPTSMSEGQQLIIDTNAKTVVNQNGVNMWQFVGPAPTLFAVPAGTTYMDIALEGATTASSIVVSFYPRYLIAV